MLNKLTLHLLPHLLLFPKLGLITKVFLEVL